MDIQSIVSTLIRTSRLAPINMLCWNTGAQIIIMMLVLIMVPNQSYNRAVFLYVPLLIYDFAVMLLLSGPNQRYFYCNAVLFLPIIFAVLYKRGKV